MCKCKNVEFGSYANQIQVNDLPEHMRLYKSKGGATLVQFALIRVSQKRYNDYGHWE